MENYLTPSERMQLAERLRAQRAARLGYSPTDTSALSYYLPKTAAHPLSRQVRGATVPEGRSTETREAKDDAEWYERAGATLLDLGANVGLGAFDALEGIYDIGAGLVGEIGGWFSEDFKKAVVEHVEYDAIGSIEKTLDDLGLEHSYLNEEGPGSFVGDVARGVGGMLPAIATSIAITAASAGTAAPVALGLTGAQLASLGVMAGGAAGQSTEEALNDGANLEGALLYGAASGAVEAGTEMLLPGLTGELTGKGLPFLKSLAKSEVADTGAKRIFKGMAEEAFEEGLAAAANPALKTTYKGAEALKEYTEPEFLGDVLRDAALGAAVGGVFGNTVGRIQHTSGKDADISASIEAIKNNDKEGARLVAENGALTESEEAKLRENKLKNIANIENALQSVSDEKRAKLMERHNLKNLFDESGKISPDFKAELMGGTVEAPNTQTSAVEDGTGGSVTSGGVDRRYASYGLWGKQKTVDADLAEMTEEYRKITKDENARVELFRGELTDAEAETFADARRAIHNLSERTATGIELALVEGSSDSTRVDGAVKGNTVYISKESLSDGSWAKTTVEEISHFAEGTESYRKVIKFLAKDERFADAVLNSLTAKGNPYGFTKADVDSILKKLGTRNAYVLDRRSSAGYNVSTRFALKRAKYIKIAQYERTQIHRELSKIYRGIDEGIADGIAVEVGNAVYIVDSGKTGAQIDFGVREKIIAPGEQSRKELVRRKNNDARSKGYISDGLSSRLGDGDDLGRDSNRRSEPGAELSADQEQSQHHTQGVRGELRGSERGDRVRGISDKAEFSLKSTSEGEPTEPVDGEVSSGEELTWKERMLINELRAHLSAEALGSEAFMRKILESDASLAEKLLNRIKSLKNAFTGSKDPSVRAQSTRLSKAEKLWLKAVDDAGYKYAAGKIVKMLAKEKERQDEENISKKSVKFLSEEDLSDYLRAGGRSNKYKQDAIHSGKKIILTSSEEISDYIERAIAGDTELPTVAYGKVDVKLADDVSEYSDGKIQIENYYLELVAHDIRHVYQGHLQAKRDGNVDLAIEDFLNIPLYVATYDDFVYATKYKSGNTKICLSKKINDGRVLIIETVSKSHGSIEFKNMIGISEEQYIEEYEKRYKKRNSANSRGSENSSNTLRDATASKDSIHQSSSKINPSEQKTSEKDFQPSEFSLSTKNRGVDNYTEKQYNDFGWAYEENALSGGKRDDFHSKFAQVVKGRVSAPKTKNGEYMIAVSDIYDSDMEGVNNTIVYAKGSIESPEITRVLDIDEYEETILDPIRRRIYDFERRGIQQKTGNIFRFHYAISGGYGRYRQRNYAQGNRNNSQLGVRRGGSGKETRRLKEVRFDEDGNEISRTYYENPQFSLSTKQESDGARAKANANRSRSKTYTRAEAAAIMNAVAEGATDAEGNPIRIKGQKGKLIDALWERLNEVDENSGKRGGMALDLADHMIRASVVEDLEYDPSEEVYLDRLDVLNGYHNKLDLSSLRGEIKHAYNDKSGRVYLTWSQKDGGMTPDQIKEELAERGIVIEADNPADILFEMDRMYTEAREYFKQKTNARLSDWMNADELNAYRQSLAQKILKETEGKGSASELARDYRRREADFKRREAFMKEEIARMRNDFKASSDLVYKVGKLRKQLTDGIKKQHSVKSINDPRFKESLGKLTGMTRAGQLLDKNTRKIFASVNEWYTKENELFRDHSTDDGKIEPNRYYNEEVKACIDALAKGKGRLTGEDIKRADLAVSYFSKLIESYNMVYRNGRYVDAVEIAKKNIANVKRTKLLKCGMMHKIYQKGLADIVDPVTLMRYADGYESGFFVETFEELRRGAMEMAFTRMELMEDYDAFFEEHKDYPKRMEEVVEFRGVKIPRNVLLSAYMTSKREHSHKGFVESGMTFKDPKTGDGVRIAPLGDPSVTYTDAEVERMIANMQKEMEAHFNDTDRAYISMVEKIFDRCADIKTETDMHRLGFTNVDKDAYYYPIARATRPINLDSDSILEAMERVNSLSMNKDTVKGANAMLYIDTVDAVFRRHVNQVSLYHGLSDAVDNFNKLVNLNTNDGPGVPISINTELDTAFGKMALNYLRTMKNDIEGMATLSESDRKWNKLITELRGKYATFQLGANPKVWASQLSSIFSSSNLLDYKSIMYGITHVSTKEAADGGEASKTRIEVGMSEDRRAEILRKKIIKPTAIQIAEGFDVDIEALERNRKSIVEKPLLKKLRELGFLKGYQADGVNVDFEFTAKSLRKSMNAQVSDYGGNLADLAKVVMNLDPLLENAVLLEVHRDKAKGTPKENARLVQTYVLLSAYTEGDSVTPVQFEVKQFVDDQNRLYLAVALTKIKKTGVMDDTILENQASTRLLPISDISISHGDKNVKRESFDIEAKQKTGVMDDTALTKGERTRLLPVSDISISRLIENINPVDENFFKYIPDAMLTEEQIRAKDRALEKEARKYGKDPKEYVKNYRIKDDASASQKTEEKEVDKYCRLAKLRHSENTVVEAQSVMKRTTNKLTELSMKPIGGVDRFVINRLWGACQAQVAANHKGDSSMEIGKEANKKEAGKLLERVILETQQNSLMTERSGWMRSKNELVKGLTMFSADAMKNVGRVFDGIGEIHVLKQELKSETLTENERKALEKRLKEARKRAVRASAALIANAVFMAAIALAFQSLMRQNEDKEPEEIAGEFGVDAIGNLLGGIPLLRDAYGFFANGYEIDHFLLSTMNDFLATVQGSIETIGKGFDGTLTSQDAAKAVRDVVYSIGQLSGLPFRNLYKYTTGLVSMVSPSTGYWIGSQFKHNPYRADLKKAIDAGDTHKVSTIAGLITEENYSNQSKETKETLRALVSEGHVVLPRTLSDTVTVNNETVTLTDEQKAKMQQVYAASDKAVDELVSMQMFRESTSEEKAKALGKIYDLYYNLAVDHALGLDTEERSVLFAEALDVELLAMIAARANELKADTDKEGKAISGSRKAKVTKLVASLKLTATEKYMVMGYLGYRQTNGANQVKAYINRLDLSKEEKERLFAYCGYGAAS